MDFVLPLVILGVAIVLFILAGTQNEDGYAVFAICITIAFLFFWGASVGFDVAEVSDLKAFYNANALHYVETVDETLAVTDRAKGDAAFHLGELAFQKTGQEAAARIAEKRDAIVKYNESLVFHRYANERWWAACFILTPPVELELIKIVE